MGGTHTGIPVLRLVPDSMVYQALKNQSQMNMEGNLLMDAPPHTNIADLTRQAKGRSRWREITHVIR